MCWTLHCTKVPHVENYGLIFIDMFPQKIVHWYNLFYGENIQEMPMNKCYCKFIFVNLRLTVSPYEPFFQHKYSVNSFCHISAATMFAFIYLCGCYHVISLSDLAFTFDLQYPSHALHFLAYLISRSLNLKQRSFPPKWNDSCTSFISILFGDVAIVLFHTSSTFLSCEMPFTVWLTKWFNSSAYVFVKPSFLMGNFIVCLPFIIWIFWLFANKCLTSFIHKTFGR